MSGVKHTHMYLAENPKAGDVCPVCVKGTLQKEENSTRCVCGYTLCDVVDKVVCECVEEGDTCKSCGTGTYQFLPPENCSCHINAPCSSCLDVQLQCVVCGEYAYE